LPTRPIAVTAQTATTVRLASGIAAVFVTTPVYEAGTMYLDPGVTTKVFSFEESDDGTADEWHGGAYEFYYVVAGEFTVHFGTDADKIRAKQTDSIVARAGEFLRYLPGFKYAVTCTSPTPGTFLWVKSSSPPGVTERLITATPVK
jgi:mannose-6-phosphate isomerase-like protein (cupin superfamily)